MPVVANPNPDRARRGTAAPATALVPRDSEQSSDEEEAAPAAAKTTLKVAGTAKVPATTAKAAQLAPIFGFTAVRQTGLEEVSTARKRHATVQRVEPCWECVEVTDEEDENPT